MLLAIIIGCANDNEQSSEEQESTVLLPERSENSRDIGERSEGEESGTEYTRTQTYDEVRNGARLVLVYDEKSNAFAGMVENTTNETLKNVQVEVHLSNGIELGPTTAVNLKPKEKKDVKLPASEKAFEGWSAHPEVGGGEAGHGEEEGENGREGSREHEGEHQ